MAMAVIAFLIISIWGKGENGRKNNLGMTALIAFFVPFLTPIMAIMSIRTSIKERSFKLFLLGFASIVIVIIQVTIMYKLRTV